MSEVSNVQRSWTQRFVFRWTTLVGLLVIGLLSAAAQPVLQMWRDRQALTLDRQCRELRDRKDWSKLAAESESWSKSDPKRAKAWLFRAEAAEGQGKFVEASDYLFHVPPNDERYIPAYMGGVTLLLGQANRPIEGIAAIHQLFKREPRIAEAHKHLIQFYALTLQRQKLLHQIRFAIANEREPPESYVYLLLVDTLRLSNGVEMNSRWLEQYPDNEIFLVARALHMQDEKEEARRKAAENKSGLAEKETEITPQRSQTLADLFQRFPNNLELLSYEIELALLVGDTDRVIALLSKAPPEIDDDNRFWRYKGQIHEARQELDEAEKAYRKSARMNPLEWRSWNSVAIMERLRGNFAEAGRLQGLVKRADGLRIKARALPLIEEVGPDWLRPFADIARDAGDKQVADALFRRLNSTR